VLSDDFRTDKDAENLTDAQQPATPEGLVQKAIKEKQKGTLKEMKRTKAN